jgi:hypothetical protein
LTLAPRFGLEGRECGRDGALALLFRGVSGHWFALDARFDSVLPVCSHNTRPSFATESAWNGYLLTVACPCGVTFERWVTPMDAELDLLHAASLH